MATDYAYEQTSPVSFITCVKWVKKGVSKAVPEVVKLSAEELDEVIQQNREELKDLEDEEEESTDERMQDDGQECNKEVDENEDDNMQDDDVMKEYKFSKYDDDGEGGALMGIAGLTVFSDNNEDPYITIKDGEDEEENEEERENFTIKPSDNLVLAARVEEETNVLEVYVFNKDEGSLYVHHDILLPASPLCLEWLNFDPTEETPGNFVAVGSMSPVIEVWDLDIVDSVVPAFKLGKKARRKKNIPGVGHTDAVLALSWNTHADHVLASGSADKTVRLWDMTSGSVANTYEVFEDRINSLDWHPSETQTLLAGSADRYARVLDCRTEVDVLSCKLRWEVEKVLWNIYDPDYYLVGTQHGMVYYVDRRRTDEPLWKLKVGDKEITGLSLSSQYKGLLVTSSMDRQSKIWDLSESPSKPQLIRSMEHGVGNILCMDPCPDYPLLLCMGGDHVCNNFKVWNLEKCKQVRARYGLSRSTKQEAESSDDGEEVLSSDVKQEALLSAEGECTMETETKSPMLALQSLSLQNNAGPVAVSGNQHRKKKHHKKKKES